MVRIKQRSQSKYKEERVAKTVANGGQKVLLPKSAAELDEFLFRIGDKMRRLQLIETKLNAALEKAKKDADEQALPLRQEVENLVEGIRIYSELKKDELLKGGERSFKLANGTIGWRWSKWKVGEITDLAGLIKKLRKLDLSRFIRRPPPELDKSAALKDRLAAEKAGIPFSRKEIFFVQPTEVSEITVDSSDLKIVVDEETE
ncbi:MAG: host-nuclease inhibitor Gam family protein [Acidobacteriaceae bacterium]